MLGTPAEEGGGGKISMIEKSVFGNIDVAMMVHPYAFNRMYQVYLGIQEAGVAAIYYRCALVEILFLDGELSVSFIYCMLLVLAFTKFVLFETPVVY